MATAQSHVTLEQIEAVVTKAVILAATKDREQIIILTENMKMISETVIALDHTVNGNGRDGLDKRVDRLERAHEHDEQTRKESPWRAVGVELMKTLIIGVIFAVLALIVSHGIPIN